MLKVARRIFVAAVGCVLVCTQFVSAQIADQVPEKALVVFKVRNLQETSGKLQNFATQAGFAMFIPQMSDPLGALQQRMKIEKGLDKTGEFAFVGMDPKDIGAAPGSEGMLLLVPVTNYDEFLSNFQIRKPRPAFRK